MKKFRNYLLNEEKGYLGNRVNDVLSSMQDIQGDMENLGSRHLTRLAEEIVNQIRKILHGNWTQKNHKYLTDLQKIGVAVMKTIEEKGDLKDILPAATQELQDLAGKLGIKVNDLQAPEMPGEDIGQDDFEETGDGPAEGDPMPQDQEMQQDPMQMGQDVPMQQPMDQQPMPMQQPQNMPPMQ